MRIVKIAQKSEYSRRGKKYKLKKIKIESFWCFFNDLNCKNCHFLVIDKLSKVTSQMLLKQNFMIWSVLYFLLKQSLLA